jgi:hypothetical protein
MIVRKLHRLIGILMLLPLIGWCITGFVFFIKPGYEGAYELLQPKTYPLDGPLALTPDPSWLEVRYLRTVIGNHLLVRTAQGWRHLDPTTGTLKRKPTGDELRALMADAFSFNPARYGQITNVTDGTVTTNTDVRITLNWDRLSLHQTGKDTDRIDRLYKIHYLQWTGVKWVDRILGITGLTLVAILSVLGFMLGFNLKVTRKS